MFAFSLSIFLSAYLLFTIQPLLAKKLLPWFGGSPGVWLSIVLFFQTALLVGYFYAFLLSKISKISRQLIIHSTFMLLSIYFLPITPLTDVATQSSLWQPLAILAVLSQTILLPGIIISSSSPLLQHWYTLCYHTEYPYRFYSLSNFGSLFGLLAFPFILEPLLGLNLQLNVWSTLYAIYVLSCGFCLWIVFKSKIKVEPLVKKAVEKLRPFSVICWLLLTAFSSILLLSTTQIMMQNVAGFPLLWVVPLSLYLISFIITFYHPKWYYRPIWLGFYAILATIVLYISSHHDLSLITQIALYSYLLFSGCMICHGELFRLKPPKEYLTTYYLIIALGGVLGGLFVNIMAPLIFNEWWDFYLCLLGIFVLAGYLAFYHDKPKPGWWLLFIKGMWVGCFVVLGGVLSYHLSDTHKYTILSHRNFFGNFQITEKTIFDAQYHDRQLRNGEILHGQQYLYFPRRAMPTTYFSKKSGVSYAINFQRVLKEKKHHKGLRIGIIGLGAGTIAALTRHGDLVQFYEIDPDVEKIAKTYFYYLKDAKSIINVAIGDGRLKLSQEFKESGSHQYDVIVIDAFNGDAIPVHLLTYEAMKVYLSHLSADGVLAFHISSRYVDLYPPLQALAQALNLSAYVTHNSDDVKNWISSSEWVLISKNPSLGTYLYNNKVLVFRPERTDKVWTDDYNYLVSLVRW